MMGRQLTLRMNSTIVRGLLIGRTYVCSVAGYCLVVSQVGPALNYDELVVYKEEATLPAYLIVYSLT